MESKPQTPPEVIAELIGLGDSGYLSEPEQRFIHKHLDTLVAERIIVSQEARIAALEAEVAKLTPLAVAVGGCNSSEVPESVYKAFQMPAGYHADEVVRLREREAELEHRVRQLERAERLADKEKPCE